MLESYFVRPATIDRIRASWIGSPIERYVDWLTERGYAERSVLRRVPILVRFGAFAADRGAVRWDGLPAHVEAFVADWLRARCRDMNSRGRQKVAFDIRNAVEQMLRVALPEHATANHRPHARDPFVDRVPGFFVHLRDERGLRETSIRHYRHFLRRFEGYLERINCDDLGALSPPILGAFIIESAGLFGRTAMTGLCSALRVFLRYIRRQGIIARDLSRSVEPPQVYRLADYHDRSAGTKCDACWRSSIAACRLAAVTMPFCCCSSPMACGHARLPISCSTILIGSVNRLHVRERKADHVAVYPLSPVVGEAILAYLQNGRPEIADRHLFFRHLAPHRPLTFEAVSGRASYYLHKAGVPVRRAGSHTLRHTCVQRLVDAGFPLKTIGDYVGHRSASSTEIYAKVAVETLRDVALGDGEALP